ncbi:cellulase family glycosylhydrolase [Terrimonas alba]|uniref:cellulase family glycosylhydrolase n=1 Tax=Terrimonas alba TaxID=3349636 RepID=UPI0035F438DE
MKKRTAILLYSFLVLIYSCSKKDIAKTDTTPPTPIPATPVAMAGVNWADGRDNFVDGWVIPSGLEAGDDYNIVSAKADAVLSGFQTNMPGVNTVRLPINPPSILEVWWNRYTGAIDKAISKNMNVILACWESASSRNGLIDNTTAFWNMWDTVVTKYSNSAKVFFEVFNEPHGYSLPALTDIYVQFLSRYPNVPRERILLGGTGYSENVTDIGADSRFSGCLLALHNYAFWATRSLSDWQSDWRSRFGSFASRTIVTEFGAGMTTGKDYSGLVNNDNEIAYIQGSTNVFRTDKISSVYWPGLRDNDSYSIQTRSGSGVNIALTTTNISGVSRIRYGWGL